MIHIFWEQCTMLSARSWIVFRDLEKAFKAAKQIAIECDIFTQDINNRSKPKELKDYVFMPNDTSKIIRKSILWKLLKVLDKNGLNMTH